MLFLQDKTLTKRYYMNICHWFLSLILSIPVTFTYSQEIHLAEGKSGNRILADSLFSSGNFAQALPLFQEFYNDFPQDYYYNYALGVCYMNSCRRVDSAIPYLSKASTGDVPNKVYFYMAEAMRKTYQFDKAIEYYRRFTINGGSKDIKTNEIEQYVNICENGNSLLKYIYSPQIIDKKRVGKNDFFQYYSLTPESGSITIKPDDLKTSVDQKQNESSVIFYPKNPQVGEYIYYSSYGKSTIYGKDIYRIKRLEDGYWGKPENLGEVINTQEDEDFPYIMPDGKTLYFTSVGHYSMGGYDIYRSTYDSNTKKWSTPENLGFPFSSPYDDILYLSDSNDSLACFATNRNCEGDSVEIVMYKIDKNPIQRSYTTVEEVQSIALLKTSKDKVIKVTERQDQDILNAKVKPKAKTASFKAVENDPEYIRVITNGFIKQKETDSLRVKLEKLRERFDYISTAEERKALELKVVKVENALLAAQNEADQLFTKASQIEQEYLTGKRKQQGSTNSTFKNDNPDYLYQAQFASTVFRSDELSKLKQAEALQGQINSAREETVTAKAKYSACAEQNDSTSDCKALYSQMITKMNIYNGLVFKWFDAKYKIYSDCLMVAIVKSGNNNSDDAKAEIERAKSHFRTASTIKNNLSDEGKTESIYEASLLYEIGILRLELAFAHVWGMNLFEQQITSKTMRLERIAFGSSLPPITAKVNKKDDVDEVKAEVKQEVGISRVDSKNITPEPILIKEDESSTFQVVDKSPYDAQNPIPVNESLPTGVIYKIQLGVYSKALEISTFKGMIPVSIERASGAKVSKYYIGRFYKLSEAERALAIVKTKGFKDAFIVAWFNGKSIPLTRAQTMESKQGEVINRSKSRVANDSISVKGRIYLVQIGKYTNKLPDNVQQTVKAMASGKDIIRKPNDQGQMIYSIGNYSNYDEANRLKDNLIASGISGVEVITVEIDQE